MSDEEKMKMFWAVLLSVVIGGGGTTAFNKFSADARNDPFTGTQGRALQSELNLVERRVDLLERDSALLLDYVAGDKAVMLDLHDDFESLQSIVSALPPRDWRYKIEHALYCCATNHPESYYKYNGRTQ